MASPQIFEDLSSVFSILLQKKSEHTFLYYPLFQDYLNLLTLVEKYGGNLTYGQDDGYFETKIILPDINDEK